MSTLPNKSKFDEYVKIGLIRCQSESDLMIYQYTVLTQYDRLWNNVTRNARGIVFDKHGRIVQRCLPKFFNSNEPDGIIDSLINKSSKPVVQDKLDGSLIKVSNDPSYGLVVTSKASFNTDQSRWAREIIDEKSYVFEQGYTYHFELIHPKNQIVLNYGDKRALVLFCIIDNENGEDVNIYTSELSKGFELVEVLSDSFLSDVNKMNDKGLREGVVANFGTYRQKIKTDEYVRLHRIVTNFTPKKVWESLSLGITIDRPNMPEEFIAWLDETESDLKNKFSLLYEEIHKEYELSGKLSDKELGLSNVYKHKNFVFAMRNGKDISQSIWKKLKPKEDYNG